MANALASEPTEKRSPREKRAHYIAAVKHSKTMDKILAPARPRVASDASDPIGQLMLLTDRQLVVPWLTW